MFAVMPHTKDIKTFLWFQFWLSSSFRKHGGLLSAKWSFPSNNCFTRNKNNRHRRSTILWNLHWICFLLLGFCSVKLPTDPSSLRTNEKAAFLKRNWGVSSHSNYHRSVCFMMKSSLTEWELFCLSSGAAEEAQWHLLALYAHTGTTDSGLKWLSDQRMYPHIKWFIHTSQPSRRTSYTSVCLFFNESYLVN